MMTRISAPSTRGNIIYLFVVMLTMVSVIGLNMVTTRLTQNRIVDNDANAQIALALAESGIEKGLRYIRLQGGGQIEGAALVEAGMGLGNGYFDVNTEVGDPTADVEWTTVGFEGGFNSFNPFELELQPPLFLGWNSNFEISMANPATASIFTSVINQQVYFYYRDTSQNVRVRAMHAFTGNQLWETNLGRGRVGFGSVVGVSGTDRIYFIFDRQVLRSSTGLPMDADPTSYDPLAVHNRPTVVALRTVDGTQLWEFPDGTYSDPDSNLPFIQGLAGTDGTNPLSRPTLDGVEGDTEAVSSSVVPVQYTAADGTVETHLYFSVIKRAKLDPFQFCTASSVPPCLDYGGGARGWQAADVFNNVSQVGNVLDFDFMTTTQGATIDDMRLVFRRDQLATLDPPPVVTLDLTTNWTQNTVGANPVPPLKGRSPCNAGAPAGATSSDLLTNTGGTTYQFNLFEYCDCDGDPSTGDVNGFDICHDESFEQQYYGLTFVREVSVDGSTISLYIRSDPPNGATTNANRSRFAGHVSVNGAVLHSSFTSNPVVKSLDDDYNINNPQVTSSDMSGRCAGTLSNDRAGDTFNASGNDCEREYYRLFHLADRSNTPVLIWEYPNERFAGLVSDVRVGNDTQWSRGEFGPLTLGRLYTSHTGMRRKRLYTVVTEIMRYMPGSSTATFDGWTCTGSFCPNNATKNPTGDTINDFYPLQRLAVFALDDEDSNGDLLPDRVRLSPSDGVTPTHTWQWLYDPYELEGSPNADTGLYHPTIIPTGPTGSTVSYTFGTYTASPQLERNNWLPYSQLWGQIPIVFRRGTDNIDRLFVTGKHCDRPTSQVNCGNQSRVFAMAIRDNYEEETAPPAGNPFTELWAWQFHEDEDNNYCYEGTCTTAAGNDTDLQQDYYAVDDNNFYFTWNNDVNGAAAVQHIAALRVTDGVQQWRRFFPVFQSGVTTHASPAVANDAVYFGITLAANVNTGNEGDARLFALSTVDGSILDNYQLPDTDDSADPAKGWPAAAAGGETWQYYGFNMAPAVANNAIYVGLHGGGKQRVFGLSPDFNLSSTGYYANSQRTVRIQMKEGIPVLFKEGYD